MDLASQITVTLLQLAAIGLATLIASAALTLLLRLVPSL